MWWAVVWYTDDMKRAELALVWDTKAKDELVAALSAGGYTVGEKHVTTVTEAENFHARVKEVGKGWDTYFASTENWTPSPPAELLKRAES